MFHISFLLPNLVAPAGRASQRSVLPACNSCNEHQASKENDERKNEKKRAYFPLFFSSSLQ